MRCVLGLLALTVLGTAPAPAAVQPPDRDGDGLTDEQEEVLGTDPDAADLFRTIVTDGVESEERRNRQGYDPTKDLLTVEFCHAGQDRYVWRATFAQAPRPDDTVLHLYIDADADAGTGRKGPPGTHSTGTEYMVTVAEGHPRATHYRADGERAPTLHAAYVVSGKSLIVSADLDLGRDDAGIRYGLYVLCHTATLTPSMSDVAPKRTVSGLPVVDRRKIKRLIDHTESEGVDGTFGIDLVRDALHRKDVVVVPHDKLEMDGFAVDAFTYRKFAHVRMERRGGNVRTEAPQAGTYHVGFLMYDDPSDERVAIKIEGRLEGVVVANADNNRWWIYWLEKPYTFNGAERVELVGFGPSGRHGICNIIFLPKPLTIRNVRYEMANMACHTPPGEDGRVTASWTTTWPCATRFDYGKTREYGEVAGKPDAALLHRVVLRGLHPDAEWHGRAVGMTREGTPWFGPDMTFRAKAAALPATVAGVRTVPLTVRNPHDVPAVEWPVTSGVPFPRGVLGQAAHVRLTRDGREVPAQIATTGRWNDGSVKWILVTFTADVAAGEEADYHLEFGRGVRRAAPNTKLSVIEAEDGVHLETGAFRVRVDRRGRIVLPSGRPCSTVLVDAKSKRYSTDNSEAEVTVEESGAIRAVVKTSANLSAADGTESFRVETRVLAYAGAPFVRVFHTFVVDRPDTFSEIDSLHYVVPASPRGITWRVALAGGGTLRLDGSTPVVRQRFDDRFVTGLAQERKSEAGRVLGRAVAAGDDGCAVALRDFWQQYPKGFSLGADGIHVELCPDFPDGLYDKFPFEKEGHQLYYYLLNGRYKFKRGVAKTHEMLLCFAPAGRRDGLCRLFQRPLLATAPPEWYCQSRAFYDLAARDEFRFKAYEEAIDANLKGYVEARERQRDYGLMNYGDWYGERGTNWGNVEYDTQQALLLEYVRSGNPEALFLADQTEIHNRDIDTVQWAPDPGGVGAVYVHQMCHVGGYYDKPVPGAPGYPRGGYSVSHAWVEGHFNHFFLTGDRRSYETGAAVADFFIRKELSRPYDFLSCRTPGWHLIMNAAAYAATGDPYYLNASRVIVDRVLEMQDVEPRALPAYQCEEGRTHQVGGWSHMMIPGHCRCEPRHQGNAAFMVAVLLSGLKYYHDVTEDPRIEECIIRGAHYMLDETYSEEVKGFRYTSCPNTSHSPGAAFLMVEGLARAYRWTGDERFRRVLTESLPIRARGNPYGKPFSYYYRVGPRVLADMAESGLTFNEFRKAQFAPFKKPDWLAKATPRDLIVIQAEDFTAQGGGQCQTRDDRQAIWGKMITFWHRDVDHWLEWTFDVPRDGYYVPRFRYATSSAKTVREFRIDGQVPVPAAGAVRFERTGGFGHTVGQWRFRSLTNENGEEVRLFLKKGAHCIRMTNLGDGLGMDFIVLVRVPEAAP